MSWYSIVLSTSRVAEGELDTLQRDFASLFLAAGSPKEMALFSGKFSREGSILYLSPGSQPYASDLISAYGGVPCEKPPPPDFDASVSPAEMTALLVGRTDAWDLLK
jgi:hypothetical protein